MSAIALPQYKKAVLKVDLAKMQTILMSVVTAQKAYFLENGEYATSLDNLAIEFPVTGTCQPAGSFSDITERSGYKIGSDGFCLALQKIKYGGPTHSIVITFGAKTSKYNLNGTYYNGLEYLLEDWSRIGKGSGNNLYCRTDSATANQIGKFCTGRLRNANCLGAWYDAN